MGRKVAGTIATLLLTGGVFLWGHVQGWSIQSVLASVSAPAKQGSPDDGPTWIRRNTFVSAPQTILASNQDSRRGPRWVLAAALERQILACGARELFVGPAAEAADVVSCRCHVEVPGTPYLRRFECVDSSADRAGQRLLAELRQWAAARRSPPQEQDTHVLPRPRPVETKPVCLVLGWRVGVALAQHCMGT